MKTIKLRFNLIYLLLFAVCQSQDTTDDTSTTTIIEATETNTTTTPTITNSSTTVTDTTSITESTTFTGSTSTSTSYTSTTTTTITSTITSTTTSTTTFSTATTNTTTTTFSITTRTVNTTTSSISTVTTTSTFTTTSSSTTSSTSTVTRTPLTSSSTTTIGRTTSTISTLTTTLTTSTSNSSSFTATISTTTTTTTIYTADACNSTSLVALPNGTCISNSARQQVAFDTINNANANSTEKADALSLYFQSTVNSSSSSNTNNTLSAAAIANLTGITIVLPSPSSFLMVQPVNQSNNITVFGASFQRGSDGDVVDSTNENNVTTSNLSAAAILSNPSLSGVVSLNMLIIDKPTIYENIDNSTDNKSLASSVIVATAQPNVFGSSKINISLYFKVLPEYQPNVSPTYLCSFYDTNTLQWNETGCSAPIYNTLYNRYECSCNHSTTFALIWLPNTIQPNYLTPQNIVSLVSLSFSILCFIVVIIHSLTMWVFNPMMFFEAQDLLPLISSTSTTILFIFYIALTMTVYTRISFSSLIPTPCFTSASVLMFFVYFFLIFMFCVKTSIGYFNYLRFVYLFPQPSYRKLFILLIISFFISITWTSFAAGFNSNTSFDITQLQGNILCWFTQNVIYYFVTIPVAIFLLLSFITIIFVAKHIVHHIQHATSPHHSYERIKQCVLVLLSSCVTQGIGWLFGPFISFVNPAAANVLGWFFVIFNGLEGVWTILLYIIIRSQCKDEQRRFNVHKKMTKKTRLSSIMGEREHTNDSNEIVTQRF